MSLRRRRASKREHESYNVDSMPDTARNDSNVPHERKNRRRVKKRYILITTLSCLLLTGGGVVYWRLFVWQPAVVNPFTPHVSSSMQFPLYYPTQLPTGYRIDTKSVNVPQQGVVVFNMIGPKSEKVYMSEEARPSTFDLGGFYQKFQDLKEIGVTDGAIAVGRVDGGQTEIASRANNKTWILSNTTAKIPFDQLTNMMKSLTLNY
jgi:hypothetical protein